MINNKPEASNSEFSFSEYRSMMEENLRSLSANFDSLYEQAVPSYTHHNRLMAYLFWQRLRTVIDYLDTQQLGQVLDFGCGAGVMFPYLARRSKKIIGIDIDLRASRFMVDNHGLEDVTLIDVDDGLGIIELETIDTILALDVLEHVDDLEGILGTFKKLLCPTGQIIVCGPSETFFYRLGRKLAGFEDHSHLRNILDIEKDLRSFFDVQLIARLYPLITLFRITTARLK